MRASTKGRRFGTAGRRLELLEELRALGPGDECFLWPWGNPERTDRYATVQVNGKTTTAHRWVYEWINGPLGDDLDCAHECDTPLCVRPSHLKGITHGANLAEAYRKGRKKVTLVPHPGEAHPNARLTEEQVRQIRALSTYGVPNTLVASIYGLAPSYVSQINNRLKWAHVE